ncbi:uncharacterized protein LOC124896911 [Capsicum annuum]|uniref:uncharacterized protein LOC124896911 n=1 Tax=Capsicum annuum TaxID=4072 RepID=UPI001FB08D8C|nr:uncharacterized protein LOC124896911 [Capsicum annuum]
MVNPTAHETAAVATGSTKDATNSTLVDSTYSYYLYLSDSPGMILVNAVFYGKGYGGWRRAIRIALSAKNKLGFIDGSFAQPESSSPLFQPWSRCNDMVISWILNSLSKDIAESVLYFKIEHEIWNELEDIFGQSNGAQLYQLQKELSGLVQGNSDIPGYYTKFLMGLNNTYSSVRSNILMISPLPSVNQAYSLLLQDGKQREIYVSKYPIESTFLAANQQGENQKNNRPNNKFKGYSEEKKNNMFCNYCKKLGHTIDHCYRLKGFPPNFKFTKPRRFQGGSSSN